MNGLAHHMQDAEDGSLRCDPRPKPAIRSGNFRAYLDKAAGNRACRVHARKRRIQTFSPDDAQAEEMLAARPEDGKLGKRDAAAKGKRRKGTTERISLQEREDGTMSELKKNETQALADEELENVAGGMQPQKEKEEKEMIMKE